MLGATWICPRTRPFNPDSVARTQGCEAPRSPAGRGYDRPAEPASSTMASGRRGKLPKRRSIWSGRGDCPGGIRRSREGCMFAEQTPAVARALEAAHRWAQVEGAAALTPRHLLLGLLDETEGRAAKWLAGHGFDGAAWLSKQPAAPARSESAPSPLPNDP